MSFGFGRLSRSSAAGVVSSSSMISLQRSMHSSQMKTPGPAISFFTWRWLLPQKLQSSCSFPSLARATGLLFYSDFTGSATPQTASRTSAVGDHPVDDSVLHRLLGRHEEVPIHVLAHLLLVLLRVVRDDLLQLALERDRLPRVDLDIGRLTLVATPHLVEQDLRVRQGHPLPFGPSREEDGTHAHRDPDADRPHVRLDELHRVVDREARVDVPAGRVDVQVDVL